MKKKIMICRVCLAVILIIFLSGIGCSDKTICRVVNYAGWADAIEMTNSQVRVIVAPSVGRIIHYGYIDQDNLLWVNPHYMGKTLKSDEPERENGRMIWMNFGGDKVWPTAQNQFLLYNGRSWPPDVIFDGGKNTVELLSNGVRLTTATSPAVGARLIREITLINESPRLLIKQRMQKIQIACNKEYEPVPLTIWNLAQIRTPQEMLFNTISTSQFPNGFYIYPFYPDIQSNLMIKSDIGILHPDSLRLQKISSVSDNWVSAIIGQTVFTELFARDSTAVYPDGNLNCKVYSDSNYSQLEVSSPLTNLLPGEMFEFTIAWDLYTLPDSIITLEEKRTAALEWLREIKL